jgi:hypothetical protein
VTPFQGVVALGRNSAPFTESFSSHWLSTVRGESAFFATGGAAFATARPTRCCRDSRGFSRAGDREKEAPRDLS